MRRKTRRALVNVSFFCSALFLILFLTGNGSSSHRTFKWTTVHYKPKSTNMPDARGICPRLTDVSKPALVVARVTADDTNWLNRLADKYHFCVYTADAPLDKSKTTLQVPENRGHEAMAYLTFLIDNYDHIPSAGAVFVHGSRWSWHNDSPDYDNAELLAALDISSALEPWGYHNLRCDWSASTCPTSDIAAQGSLATSVNAMLEPWNQRVVSDAALPRALIALFDDNESSTQGSESQLGRNDVLRSQCCAQFVVSRESIWRHSRQEYIALRQWLLDGSNQRAGRQPSSESNAAPQDDRIAGRILSYVWHILFLQTNGQTAGSTTKHIDLDRLNALACPSAAECYCRLYGRCNLEHCSAGRCHGQYTIPPGFRLPEDWAATHS
ncbi:hypothetical protein F5884DRAFT_814115 [Xylogone sp. PMI_703]|nr:hypothetical protein F5884DRAFT_814115 [Xylogone sp. PMI_703]